MSAAQHTPGPWVIGAPSMAVLAMDRTRTYRTICNLPTGAHFSLEQDEIEANRRLIAAAPEMLKALRQAANALAAIRGEQFRAPQMSALDAARAAIAKATEAAP